MKERTYFLLYKDITKINYICLLRLYRAAECSDSSLIKNKIQFASLKELAEKTGITYSTLYRMIRGEQSKEYSDYFLLLDNQILLLNDFRKKKNVRFVKLSQKEVDFLIKEDNNFLAKYLIYHKYYCGFSPTGKHNSTAKQILKTMGYSTASNKNISQLSSFNQLLSSADLLEMDCYIEKGKSRLLYYFAEQQN